jgi:hypothetical protein
MTGLQDFADTAISDSPKYRLAFNICSLLDVEFANWSRTAGRLVIEPAAAVVGIKFDGNSPSTLSNGSGILLHAEMTVLAAKRAITSICKN